MSRVRLAVRLLGLGLVMLPSLAWAGDPSWSWAQPWHSWRSRGWYYSFSQGSRVLPLAWFRSLTRAGAPNLFASDKLERFGFIPWPATLPNSGQSPAIGFGSDPDRAPMAKGGGWFSMTCAACHTSRIRLPGHDLIVDGAPAQADFSAFITDLAKALTATANDQATFQAFASRVASAHGETNTTVLRNDLTRFAADFQRFADNSEPSPPWLPGRMDAFSMISNRVLSVDLGNLPFPNTRFPDAPVRYPSLWNTNFYTWVQYTGNLPNDAAIGLPGRNFGQALGVFATIPRLLSTQHFSAQPSAFDYLKSIETYWSSVRLSAQKDATGLIGQFTPPDWPLPIDAARAACGASIFNGSLLPGAPAGCRVDDAVNCASCHAAKTNNVVPVATIGVSDACDRSPQPHLPPVKACGVRTDSRAAYILACDTAPAGPLIGAWYIDRFHPQSIVVQPFSAGSVNSIELTQEIGASALVATKLSAWPLRVLAEAKVLIEGSKAVATMPPMFVAKPGGSGCAPDADGHMAEPASVPPALAYRAVALNGVWAEGRYLHNGSVPTLADLLRRSCKPDEAAAHPADCRPARFTVGSLFYDDHDVGYRHGPDDGKYVLDTSLWGNHNTGHEGRTYGTGLDPEQKLDLIEYLKSL
jgi:hypothetical protein